MGRRPRVIKKAPLAKTSPGGSGGLKDVSVVLVDVTNGNGNGNARENVIVTPDIAKRKVGRPRSSLPPTPMTPSPGVGGEQYGGRVTRGMASRMGMGLTPVIKIEVDVDVTANAKRGRKRKTETPSSSFSSGAGGDKTPETDDSSSVTSPSRKAPRRGRSKTPRRGSNNDKLQSLETDDIDFTVTSPMKNQRRGRSKTPRRGGENDKSPETDDIDFTVPRRGRSKTPRRGGDKTPETDDSTVIFQPRRGRSKTPRRDSEIVVIDLESDPVTLPLTLPLPLSPPLSVPDLERDLEQVLDENAEYVAKIYNANPWYQWILLSDADISKVSDVVEISDQVNDLEAHLAKLHLTPVLDQEEILAVFGLNLEAQAEGPPYYECFRCLAPFPSYEECKAHMDSDENKYCALDGLLKLCD